MKASELMQSLGRTRVVVSPGARAISSGCGCGKGKPMISREVRALGLADARHMMGSIITIMDEGPDKVEAMKLLSDLEYKAANCSTCSKGAIAGEMQRWIATHEHGEGANAPQEG